MKSNIAARYCLPVQAVKGRDLSKFIALFFGRFRCQSRVGVIFSTQIFHLRATLCGESNVLECIKTGVYARYNSGDSMWLRDVAEREFWCLNNQLGSADCGRPVRWADFNANLSGAHCESWCVSCWLLLSAGLPVTSYTRYVYCHIQKFRNYK